MSQTKALPSVGHPLLCVSLCWQSLSAFVDSGTDGNIIEAAVVSQLGITMAPYGGQCLGRPSHRRISPITVLVNL